MHLHHPPSLNEQLLCLSYYCNVAVADASPQAILLASSVRKHVITPLRQQLFNDQVSNQHDEQLSTIAILQTLFEQFLTARTTPPLSTIYKTLENIFKALQSGYTQQVLSLIWHDLHSLLSPHITEWISRGLIHDTENFFITPHQDQTYTIDHQNLPPFITPQTAQAILETGLARRTISAIAPDNQSPFIKVTLPKPCTTISISAAAVKWRRDAISHLSDILPFDELLSKLLLIRDQLLQGDHRFWRNFFDTLRQRNLNLCSGNNDDNTAVERTLNAVLVALSDGNPPFVFILRNGVIPSIPLSFVEQQLFQKRCHVYTDLFSITFNARRASENSRSAFVHLNALHRISRTLDNGLMEMMILRKRMEYVIQGFENYVHIGVLHAGFQNVINALSGNKAGFDVVTSLHDKLLDDIVTKCFLKERQIRARLTAIFGVSLAFSEFVVGMTGDGLREGVAEGVVPFSVEFERNVGLLFQLLSRVQKERAEVNLALLLGDVEHVCDSKIKQYN